jgi:DNA polymerase-1
MNVKFDPKKTIFLIDGSSFLYRAYYSLRPLHTPKGVAVQAVYGFCRMIKKVLDTFNPEYIAIVWDSKGKTTRHTMFEAYKATRQAPPSDLFEQKGLILDFAKLIGFPQIAQQGIEADDIMYSIAQEQKKEGNKIVFITSDKDMAQALDENVVIFDPFKDEFIDKAKFEEKKGFPVEKLPFYFAILGDTSDNIPGVKGIGEKGATELVTKFKSLKDLYAHLDQVSKDRMRKLLEENLKNAFLSEQLFLLQYHPSGLTTSDLAFKEENWQKAKPFFEELDFKSLLKGMDTKLAASMISAEEKIKRMEKYSFKRVTTSKELHDLCFEIKNRKVVALDTETTGLDVVKDPMVGLSLCTHEGKAYYIPFGHETSDTQLSKDEVINTLKPILQDESIKKYLHHAKFDQHVLYNAGIDVKGVIFDSSIAANLVVKDWERIGLKSLSMSYFDEPMLTFEDVVKANKYKNFSQVPLELATLYAAVDAHQTFKLKKVLEHDLKEEKLDTLFHEIEMPLNQVLFDMETEGIILDTKVLQKLDKEVTERIDALEDEIIGLVGDDIKNINFNSPRQIEELLFKRLNLPPQKKSAKGTGYSTDQEVLEVLSSLHPVPALIIKHRELSKLKSTYIDALPTYINPKTGKIHTSFNQTQVATGRLASSDPNMQNIPVNSFGIRAAFKPKEGHVFLSADYSQIELRVLAHMSEDVNLTQAFLKGHDIHAETSAHLFDVPLDKVTNEMRQVGKRINFSILYGLTPFGLSKDLNIPFKDAKQYIDKYFAQYPQVSAWMESVIDFTKKNGYVTTLWGRRRYVPMIHEKNKALYEEARRIAINTVAQGTAADIMKLGMIALDKELKAKKLNAKILLQIHDELLISVPKDEQEATEKLVKKVLEKVVDWKVPLEVTTRFGNNWDEVTK